MELSEIRRTQRGGAMDTAEEGTPRQCEQSHLGCLENRDDLENQKNCNALHAQNSSNAVGVPKFERQQISSHSGISPRSDTSSWSNRIPWMKAAQKLYYKQRTPSNVSDHYTLHQDNKDGILMPSDSDLSQVSSNPCTPGAPRQSLSMFSFRQAYSHETSSQNHHQLPHHPIHPFPSPPSPSSDTLSTDDVDDWDNKEWTPKDSSYGAAFPVCGFLPKNVRRAIEFSLIAGALIGVMYVIVTVSIKLTNEHRRKNENNSAINNNLVDDDHYIEYNQDNQNDDNYVDDYFYQNDVDDGVEDDEIAAEDDDADPCRRLIISKFPSFSWLNEESTFS